MWISQTVVRAGEVWSNWGRTEHLSLFMYTRSSASLPHCMVASGQLNDWRPQGCVSHLQEWVFQPRRQILCHLLWLNLGRPAELHLLCGVGYKWVTNLPRCNRRGIKSHLLVGEQQGSRKHMKWEIWLWSSLGNAIGCLCFIVRILGPRMYRNAVKWFFVCLFLYLSLFFFFFCFVCLGIFGRAAQFLWSYFPSQGLNPAPGSGITEF